MAELREQKVRAAQATGAAGAAGTDAAADSQDMRRRVAMTLVLAAFALVAIVMSTFAWFSIADSAKARQLAIEANADGSLRFDLDAHGAYADYVITLGFDQITSRIASEQGIDVDAAQLTPVTSTDGQGFYLENGSEASASTGAYLEFTLHFISLDDSVVRLTGQAGSNGAAGTAFLSTASDALPLAMRMSFTADGQTWIFDPNASVSASTSGNVTTFGLDTAEATEANNMFSLAAGQDKSVVVRIWLEGSDANCTNVVKGADYSVSMRFHGVDVE